MPERPQVEVTRKGESRLESGHLWVYSSDVGNRAKAQAGDIVHVTSQRGRFLGTALYSSASQITLRLLSPGRIDSIEEFIDARLSDAFEHRRRVVTDSDCYRLVHADGDLLPALVIDRYGDYFAIQFLNQAMDRLAPVVTASLVRMFDPKGMVARNDAQVRRLEELPQETKVVHGEVPEKVEVRMNGLRFLADLAGGQKTGIYLDQRENYLAAARHARGRALDCFTSTGGFALHLARTCESVEAVDSSAQALAAAAVNRDANALTNIGFREADVFHLLSGYVSARRSFDAIVIDPPAFAKNKATVDQAIRGYRDLNLRALRLLGKGGVLVTCSCSYHVSEADLLTVTAEAALDAGKRLRVLERRAQASDHPILLTVPETHYLKCLIFEVV
ncbi:MAG: class I SAM-dependent rRNA methyltransferase [Candidatus Solibacter sp.]|nr:class I SAM-dependent rRNA methyltransferase [Candidatus Solibacter sp.]